MKYSVIFETFTQRYFIKTFSKKYKNAWNSTYKALILEFSLFDLLFQKQIAEIIIDSATVKICKTEFKIVGTKDSRHGSGNRCIVALYKEISKASVLLVYHKNDLRHGNETSEWKKIIKNNYPQFKDLL
jgi:hypothetical protein